MHGGHPFSQKDRWHTAQDSPLLPLPREELERIRQIILKHIQAYHITISDISVHNLQMHIAIACRRIRSGNRVTLYPADLKEIINQREYEVAGRIVRDVEDAFGLAFPREEIAYVAIHLLGTKMTMPDEGGTLPPEQVVDEKILRLVRAALDKIESELEIDLKQDRKLIMDLALHLKPAIHRYKFGMNIRNPMLEDIKKHYPLAFEAGVIAGMALEEETGIEISEDEVGYLALHLGVAIKRKKSTTAPKRCLIVCASGLGTAQLIYYKIKNRFGNRLDVVGTTEYYNLHRWDLRDIDFVISSIPISESLPVPVVEVSAVIGNPDLSRIESYILERKSRPIHYFRKDLLFWEGAFPPGRRCFPSCTSSCARRTWWTPISWKGSLNGRRWRRRPTGIWWRFPIRSRPDPIRPSSPMHPGKARRLGDEPVQLISCSL